MWICGDMTTYKKAKFSFSSHHHLLHSPFLGFWNFEGDPWRHMLIFHVFHSFFTFYESWQQPLFVFTFSAPWVTFILKDLRSFSVLFSFIHYFSLLIFVCCTILSILHQFEIFWMVESQFLLNPNSNCMGN